MRVPLSWLRDFVDIDLSIDEVAEVLTNGGLEVENITRIGLPGAGRLRWAADPFALAVRTHHLEPARRLARPTRVVDSCRRRSGP